MINEVSYKKIILSQYEEHLTTDSLKIIVNADDLGICKERDEGIFELYTKRIISSSSILVNGENFENSIKKVRQMRMPLGLHLNLTEGTPINQKEIENNSLVHFDNEKKAYVMHGKFDLRKKLSEGAINLNDIKYEIISQVKLLKFTKRFLDSSNYTRTSHPILTVINMCTLFLKSQLSWQSQCLILAYIEQDYHVKIENG
jgi:predicted glycoside hydrolase/deacetylase ChbG (UPF0249 family)